MVLQEKFSAVLGIVGGVIDLVAGFALLQSARMMTNEMMAIPASATLGAYFLLGLGILVLLTGVYMFVSPMLRNRTTIGGLMLVYGAIMIAVGVGMIEQLFSMMQGSAISGTVMIVSGLAMLYSGYGMVRRR
jgi:hypothetical protein